MGTAIDEGAARRLTATTLIVTVAVAAILHVGQDIFLPLAIAVLLTFALSPLVSLLRGTQMGRIPAVLAAVFIAFTLIGAFLLVVVVQLAELAAQLPTFQSNILGKLRGLTDTLSAENGIAGRLGQMLAAINAQLGAATAESATPPVAVEVVEQTGVWQTLRDVLLPLLAPLGTIGLVIVVVVFMLLERDELRDRFIRLFGSGDIHATTQLLEDAARRVGNYLLTLLLVNVIYAVPIGVGLWLIGVPNAMLWALLTLLLRFVPYIGSVMAAAGPLVVAFAVSEDWSLVLWTAALFLVVELITSNLIEPWLYGARAGVTPLAIIVAAIFWTWIWGPMGLILSTPLTVVLVVMGRHLPQFAVFDILFGDQPVLEPQARLYQRLLVGDVIEAATRADEALVEDWVADWHRDVGIPALLLAQADLDRGVLSAAQQDRLVASTGDLLVELAPVVAEEREDTTEVLPGTGRHVVTLGGRGRLDDLAAQMLGQAAEADGAVVTVLTHADLAPSRFASLQAAEGACVILSFLTARPTRGALLQVRRIKQAIPGARVGVVLWSPAGEVEPVMALGADFCVKGMDEAMAQVFNSAAPLPLPASPRTRRAAPRRLAVAS